MNITGLSLSHWFLRQDLDWDCWFELAPETQLFHRKQIVEIFLVCLQSWSVAGANEAWDTVMMMILKLDIVWTLLSLTRVLWPRVLDRKLLVTRAGWHVAGAWADAGLVLAVFTVIQRVQHRVLTMNLKHEYHQLTLKAISLIKMQRRIFLI